MLLRLAVALGVVAALFVASGRWMAEREPRAVEVILDLPSVTAVAEASGRDRFDVLAALRAAGANAVSAAEVTVAAAVDAGYVTLLMPEEDAGAAPLFLAWTPAEVPSWLNEALLEVLPRVASRAPEGGEAEVWRVGPAEAAAAGLESPAGVLQVGLGFDRELLAALDALGYRIAPRPVDAPLLGPDDVRRRLAPLEPYVPLGTMVFGERVAGGGAHAGPWAAELRRLGVHPAATEFASQRGLVALSEAATEGVVRLHTITVNEMRRIAPDVAVDRWLRAVRERGVTALYVRLYTVIPPGVESADEAGDLLLRNVEYVTELVAALEREGFVPGIARPLRVPGVPAWAVLFQFAGIAGAGVALLRRFVRLPWGWEAVGWGAIALGLAALEFGLDRPVLARQAGAFLAAVMLPALAVLRAASRRRGGEEGRPAADAPAPVAHAAKGRGAQPGGHPLGALLQATPVSLLGALWVVGLTAENGFVQGIELFRGVKAMHVVPPALVVLGVLWGAPVNGWRRAWGRVRDLLEERIAVKHLAVLGLLGALALLMVLRTGNEFLPVPAVEAWLRDALEEWLRIRPRNKEFLLGHPAMVVLGGLLQRRGFEARPGVAAIWAGLGSIGQLSMVNTFAHAHTPLAVSLLRTLYGLVLGAAIGLVAVGAWRWLARRLRPAGDGR